MPEKASRLKFLPIHCCIQGAVGRREIMGMIQEAGLEAVIWEDHSDFLTHLAAQLIFRFGSLNAFWATTCRGEDPEVIRETVKRGKPGYYLLIARRKGNDHG
jgi:hypothetical protein